MEIESTLASVEATYPAAVESAVWGGVHPDGITASMNPPVAASKSSEAV